jgi:ADP-heptose:LPS heptosyltransferase
MNILFSRGSLIGDIVMSLPGLTILKNAHPDCKITFPIARKCAQAADLFRNHPLIDNVYITNATESFDEEDAKKLSFNFNLKFNCFPNHPWQQDWYNYRNCCEETMLMASEDLYHKYVLLSKEDKIPKLYAPTGKIKNENAIAVWPFAGYGSQSNSRSPSLEWWSRVLKVMTKNHKVLHFGFTNEPSIIDSPNYHKMTNLNFCDQIYKSIGCKMIIGTDSGSMWVTGAYSIAPQINLLSNWLPNHHSNKAALAPEGHLTQNILADSFSSNHKIEELLSKTDEIVRL